MMIFRIRIKANPLIKSLPLPDPKKKILLCELHLVMVFIAHMQFFLASFSHGSQNTGFTFVILHGTSSPFVVSVCLFNLA